MRDSRNSYWASGSSNYKNDQGYDNRGDNSGNYDGPVHQNYNGPGGHNFNGPPDQRFGGPGMHPMGGPGGVMGGPGGMGGAGPMAGPGGEMMNMGMPDNNNMGGGGPMYSGPNTGMGYDDRMQGNMGPPNDMRGGGFRGGDDSDFGPKVPQMVPGASEYEFASKIISAVLSSGLVARQDAPPPPAISSSSRRRSPHFRNSESRNINNFEERRRFPSRRRSPSPRRSSFDRYPRSKRGFRSPPRSASRSRPSIERPKDVRSRISDRRRRSISRSREESRSKRSRRDTENRETKERKEKRKEESHSQEKSSDSVSKGGESGDGKDDDSKHKKIILKFNEEDEKKKEDFPPEALFCHMCNQSGFVSERTYLFHLEGIRHRKTANAFHAKNEASLDYLRKNAKLASLRVGGLDSSVRPSKCSTCHAIVRESFHKHQKLLEHKVVKRFMMPKCCNKYFKTRHDLDEHRLSLPHLKKMHALTEEMKPSVGENKEGTEEGAATTSNDTAEGVLERLFCNGNNDKTDELTLDNVPPFDGNTMLGLNLMKAKNAILCTVCDKYLGVSTLGAEAHLLSTDHYDSLLIYLRKKLKKERSLTSNKESDKTEKEESDKKERKEESEDEGEFPYFDDETHIVLEETDPEAELEEVRDVRVEEGVEEEEEEEEEEPTEEVGEDVEVKAENDFDIVPTNEEELEMLHE